MFQNGFPIDKSIGFKEWWSLHRLPFFKVFRIHGSFQVYKIQVILEILEQRGSDTNCRKLEGGLNSLPIKNFVLKLIERSIDIDLRYVNEICKQYVKSK